MDHGGDRGAVRRLLSAGDVAGWLGLTTAQVYRLSRERRIPVVAVGRYLRFDPTALQNWIDRGGEPTDDER